MDTIDEVRTKSLPCFPIGPVPTAQGSVAKTVSHAASTVELQINPPGSRFANARHIIILLQNLISACEKVICISAAVQSNCEARAK